MMKRLLLLPAILLLGTGVSFAQARVFTGQIMDSACARMGNHNAGYGMTGTHTPKDCTLACVKGGSTFVLYNAAHQTTYKLDDQTKPRAFAGENVRVTGTYNSKTKTIHVQRIVAAR